MNSPQDKAEMIQIMKIPIRKENFHYQNYMKTKKNKSIEQKSSKSNLLTSIMKIFIKIFVKLKGFSQNCLNFPKK